MSEFVCLYDRSFKALGNWTQHVARSWSLKRKAYETDEFTAECRGWENSADACFVALHEKTGAIKYLAFCGIPQTKDRITKVEGIDCRTLFNQDLLVDYTNINTVGKLYEYLLKTVFEDNGYELGVDYDIDTSSASNVEWDPLAITATAEVRNVFDEIQSANANFNCVLLADVRVLVDEVTTLSYYKLIFRAVMVSEERAIKLSDYDAETTLNHSVANRAIARASDGTTATYYLYKDNTVGEAYDAERCIFPPIAECYEADTIDEAKEEARTAMLENRYQDRVEIDLNGKLGETLKEMDFTYFGEISGYNPADKTTTKRLPVSALGEDSSGNRSIELGRLSKYWWIGE